MTIRRSCNGWYRIYRESNRLTALKTLSLRFTIRPPMWQHVGKHPSQNGESLETDNAVGNANTIIFESPNEHSVFGDKYTYGGILCI